MTRLCALAPLLILSACSGGDAENATAANAQAETPRPTGPAPRTPTMNLTTTPGNEAEWMQPRPGADDPQSAPYANMLDQPVVNTTAR